MPITTVKKIIGAINILISLINISAKILSFAPNSGNVAPTIIPSTMAIDTCTVKFLNLSAYSSPLQHL